jgi:hypothetical protein
MKLHKESTDFVLRHLASHAEHVLCKTRICTSALFTDLAAGLTHVSEVRAIYSTLLYNTTIQYYDTT